MTQRTYRVYSKHERARTFGFYERAKKFAELCFHRQNGILPKEPVVIVTGSGSDYREVARYGLVGSVFMWTEI